MTNSFPVTFIWLIKCFRLVQEATMRPKVLASATLRIKMASPFIVSVFDGQTQTWEWYNVWAGLLFDTHQPQSVIVCWGKSFCTRIRPTQRDWLPHWLALLYWKHVVKLLKREIFCGVCDFCKGWSSEVYNLRILENSGW